MRWNLVSNYVKHLFSPVPAWQTVGSVVMFILTVVLGVAIVWNPVGWSTSWRLLLATGILCALLLSSSVRLFRSTHPKFDLRIVANSELDVRRTPFNDFVYSLITVPSVEVNTRRSPPMQLEFRLKVDDLEELTRSPMQDLLFRRRSEFPSYMDNPKLIGSEGGVWIRDLGFLVLELGNDKVPRKGVLRFRDCRSEEEAWHRMSVPGIFDTRAKRRVLDIG